MVNIKRIMDAEKMEQDGSITTAATYRAGLYWIYETIKANADGSQAARSYSVEADARNSEFLPEIVYRSDYTGRAWFNVKTECTELCYAAFRDYMRDYMHALEVMAALNEKFC